MIIAIVFEHIFNHFSYLTVLLHHSYRLLKLLSVRRLTFERSLTRLLFIMIIPILCELAAPYLLLYGILFVEILLQVIFVNIGYQLSTLFGVGLENIK